MNPLKQKQFKLLEDTGNADLARKVDEIVEYLNKKEKPVDIGTIAEAIHNADTLYDAKEILLDFIKKIEK